MDNKQRFYEIYKCVTRDGADALLSWLENSDYFTAPASTRFHGSHEGGLLEHSLNVYDCLKAEIELEGLTQYSDETVALVALMHDLCKVHFYRRGTRNVKENGVWTTKAVYEIDERFPVGHGEKSVIILQNLLNLEAEEIMAIRCHMGGFDTSVKGGDFFISKVFERSSLAVLLHIADMKASYLRGE